MRTSLPALLRMTKEGDFVMTAELLVLVSLHTFKVSCHNLRQNCLVDVFDCHGPSAAPGLSFLISHLELNSGHFSNSLLDSWIKYSKSI